MTSVVVSDGAGHMKDSRCCLLWKIQCSGKNRNRQMLVNYIGQRKQILTMYLLHEKQDVLSKVMMKKKSIRNVNW